MMPNAETMEALGLASGMLPWRDTFVVVAMVDPLSSSVKPPPTSIIESAGEPDFPFFRTLVMAIAETLERRGLRGALSGRYRRSPRRRKQRLAREIGRPAVDLDHQECGRT